MPFRFPAHKLLVRQAAASPQLVIQMKYRQPPTLSRRQIMQHVQEHHRVHASGNRDEDAVPLPEEFPLSNVSLDLLDQLAHAGRV
jgi:hypothetical protein